MKLLLTTIAAVLVVGCGPKAPDISIHDAAIDGNIAAVKQCIAAGWGIDAKIGGWTALHHAANVGNKEIVELLIANGADVNAKDDNLTLWTPLHKAASRGHNAIVEILLSRSANVNAKDGSGRSPLDWAVLNDHTETADLLRKHVGKVKAPEFPINAVVIWGKIEAVKQHIAAGTDVNAKGLGGNTPLHEAAWYAHKEIAELLIAKGADVNAQHDDGQTPLDYAIQTKNLYGQVGIYGHGACQDLLRKHGGKKGEELKAEGK